MRFPMRLDFRKPCLSHVFFHVSFLKTKLKSIFFKLFQNFINFYFFFYHFDSHVCSWTHGSIICFFPLDPSLSLKLKCLCNSWTLFLAFLPFRGWTLGCRYEPTTGCFFHMDLFFLYAICVPIFNVIFSLLRETTATSQQQNTTKAWWSLKLCWGCWMCSKASCYTIPVVIGLKKQKQATTFFYNNRIILRCSQTILHDCIKAQPTSTALLSLKDWSNRATIAAKIMSFKGM